MTALSEHFSLEEFTVSQTASRQHLDNTPPPGVVDNLRVLSVALERVRTLLARPLIINSGYRSPAVNAAVGGAATSAHLKGWAADFICPSFGSPLDICRRLQRSDIHFDQVIEEGTWVHFSVDPRMRGQILTKTANGYATGLRS